MKNRLLTTVGIVTLLLLAEGAWVYTFLPHPADASRNSAGTMSAANGPYVSGTTINSTQVNARFADIESEITNSADRSGRGGFLAAVRGVDGTVAAPALSFTSETGTGYYRIGAGNIGVALLGTKVGEWTANGYRSGDGAVATPSLSFFNDTGSGLYRIGSNNIGFAINGSKRQEWTTTGTVVTGTASVTGTLGVTGAATFSSTAQGADGAVGSPEFSFTNDTNSGLYRVSSGVIGFATGGTLRSSWSSSGFTIGASGTAISKSVRGTLVWNPGVVTSGTITTNTITTTGSVAGADCIAGVLDPATLTGLPVQCITLADACNIAIKNQFSSSVTLASATFYCRVFNP